MESVTQGTRHHSLLFIMQCVVLGRGLLSALGVPLRPCNQHQSHPTASYFKFQFMVQLPAQHDRRSLTPPRVQLEETSKLSNMFGPFGTLVLLPGLSSSGLSGWSFPAYPPGRSRGWQRALCPRTQLWLPCLWALEAGNWLLFPSVS